MLKLIDFSTPKKGAWLIEIENDVVNPEMMKWCHSQLTIGDYAMGISYITFNKKEDAVQFMMSFS